MKDGFDIAVVGAGLVGMACGALAAGTGRDVVVLERHRHAGSEASSRNSEVIHAGLYYPPASLKARSCVEGRELVYARCRRDGIAHRAIGKLVVACCEDEVVALRALQAQAEAAGAGSLAWLEARGLAAREPRVRGRAALWSPRSGIVDAHGLLGSYRAELERAGGALAPCCEVVGLAHRGDRWRVETRDAEGARVDIEAGCVINAAGLGAERVARMAGIDTARVGWRLHPCKGDYFTLGPGLAAPTRHLVYPMPAAAGLGVHVTIDLGGRTRFGPDVAYVEAPRYDVDPSKASAFRAALARYLPDFAELGDDALVPEMAGVRAKLQGPGEGFRDFVCEESSALGAPGMLHLVGIESPGLTASEALARRACAGLGLSVRAAGV